MNNYDEIVYLMQHIGKDPSQLIFEDELTGIYNRRFLHSYFQHKVSWDTLKNNPLSLIMMDLDYFKQINDTYGHHVGDQALTWVAALIKEAAGEDNLPIRYAGDEFVILMPQRDRYDALQVGEHLLQLVREKPLQLDVVEDPLSMTFSMGIASAPENAQSGKTLMRQADTALYYAKKTGRNRIAYAGDIDPQDVFNKTALHQLESEKIAGRKSQLTEVAELLKKFSKGQSQFMLAEGAPGMGKSSFLETIRRNLARSKTIAQVKANGSQQEMFRPYYLITNILIELLNQKDDKGAHVIENLTRREITYLSNILPQISDSKATPGEENKRELREGLFDTLVQLIPRIVNFRPLVLLIDDLHFSDEATLLLFRQLILRQEVPLFICGSTSEIKQQEVKERVYPIVRFYENHHDELQIRKVPLTPLDAADIADHLHSIFPQLTLPENFERQLQQVTQGNPLFLVEILRKLVLDEKIKLVGHEWVINPLEEDYLPNSLEEYLSQKIAALDQDSLQLLHQVSAIGQDVPVSVLAGSSKKMEAEIMEFVDHATSQGLITTDFQVNDDVIRFLGRRILEIA